MYRIRSTGNCFHTKTVWTVENRTKSTAVTQANRLHAFEPPSDAKRMPPKLAIEATTKTDVAASVMPSTTTMSTHPSAAPARSAA